MEAGWQCASCLIATHGFAVGSLGSKSGSSTPAKSSPGKSSSSKLAAQANTPSKVVTPNINIISADKRLQIMKKKAAKQQENKRKHSK